MPGSHATRLRLLGALCATTLLVAVAACGSEATTESASPSSTASSPTSRSTDSSTRPASSSADDSLSTPAMRQRWGVDDLGLVSRAISDAAGETPDLDAGLTYDDHSLTFTQWVVDAPGADQARRDIRAAFDRAARGSNLHLDLEAATEDIDALQRLGSRLADASRTDPSWPEGLALTGAPDPATGTFLLEAGERADDPSVIAYFERHWPGQVTLSAEQPASLETAA